MNDISMEQEELILEAVSVEEAISQAAVSWAVSEEDIATEILDEGKRLFGLFGKRLSVKLTPKAPLTIIQARVFISDLLRLMGLEALVQLSEGGYVLDLVGEDSGIIIGRYGETLKALELIANLVIRESKSSCRIRLDCCGYRERRENNLTRLADTYAREAVRRRRTVTLEPMTSWERRIIHMALQDSAEVETHSVGEDPFRRVIVTPREKSEGGYAGRQRFR